MFDVSRFVEDCKAASQSRFPWNAVEQVVLQAIIDPTAIDLALGIGEAAGDESAQYQFLYSSNALTILRVIMPGFLVSPPHNHLVWAVIGMYRGAEDNVFYHRSGDSIDKVDHRHLAAPETMILPPDTIHSISNPIAQPSFGLHVYGGSLANPLRSLWNPFTLQEEPFQIPLMSRYECELTVQRRNDAT